MTLLDDEAVRARAVSDRGHPLTELRESETQWHLFTFSILKRDAAWNNGFSFGLLPGAHLYKRWFDAPDQGINGWAIIFRIAEPGQFPEGELHERMAGWVPPEREADADRWIAFLNERIREHLTSRGGDR